MNFLSGMSNNDVCYDVQVAGSPKNNLSSHSAVGGKSRFYSHFIDEETDFRAI